MGLDIAKADLVDKVVFMAFQTVFPVRHYLPGICFMTVHTGFILFQVIQVFCVVELDRQGRCSEQAYNEYFQDD